MNKTFYAMTAATLILAGCNATYANHKPVSAPSAEPEKVETAQFDGARMAAVLAAPRRDKDRPRDSSRHTAQTLEFFDLAPNAHVVEVLPGGGWYTRVLLPYVAETGGWYGLNYNVELVEHFARMRGVELSEEQRTERENWPQTYPAKAAKNGPDGAPINGAYLFGGIPDEAKGKMDAVLYFRALHHMNRFDPALFEQAVADSYALLKVGGIVGVVQHRAKEDYSPAEYDTTGNKGYLPQSLVITMFEQGGFVLDASSEINANPKDTADYEGGVWTLPPSLRGKDKSMQDHYKAIGESDRMTLLFRKAN
ncbi:MAG: methyltransferase [Robiginitomaculum sp.]|nr:MAG: methyltransferase [Robiginitomaculum sp.]